LGFDLLIDRKLKVWLLEINDSPSLNIYFDKEFMSGKKKTEEDICPVDLYVKSTVVRDCVTLCKKKKESIEEIDEWESLSKIHPNEDCESSQMYFITQNLRELFYAIAAVKNKSTISTGCFEKLSKTNFIAKSLGLQKIDLTLIFQSTSNQLPYNSREINFIEFCNLMLAFYMKKTKAEIEFGDFVSTLLSDY
jgi:hypothetical protein